MDKQALEKRLKEYEARERDVTAQAYRLQGAIALLKALIAECEKAAGDSRQEQGE
jgi:hypothetical protein